MQEGGSDAGRRSAIAEEKLSQDQDGVAAKKPIKDKKNYQGSDNFYFD